MAYRDIRSFPIEIPQLIEQAIREGRSIRIPCATHGQAVNRGITFRSYLKHLRTTPLDELPENHKQVAMILGGTFISGPGPSRTPPFAITIFPFEPENEFSLSRLITQRPRETDDSPPSPPVALQPPPRTDEQLWDLIQQMDMTAMKLLSPAQRSRIEELMLGATLEPGRKTD